MGWSILKFSGDEIIEIALQSAGGRVRFPKVAHHIVNAQHPVFRGVGGGPVYRPGLLTGGNAEIIEQALAKAVIDLRGAPAVAGGCLLPRRPGAEH